MAENRVVVEGHRRADPAIVIVLGVAAGIVLAGIHRPRTGMYMVAGTLAVAAIARLVLRQRDAGSLVIRSRRIDVVTMLLLAGAIGVLAWVSPLTV